MILDAHLDLAMNAMEWNRDLTQPLESIRNREVGLRDKPDRGRGTVSFPEMRRAGIGVCVATQIARFVKPTNALPGWHSIEQAWAQTQAQLAWYRAMEEKGELIAIRDRAGLRRQVEAWQHPEPNAPIGYIMSLEGADSVINPSYVERSFSQGLRAIGPAHYGVGRYAQGTDATGGLGPKGKELLSEMQRLGMILDATHLCDDSFWEALDHFQGAVWASHHNCRALVPHNRQLGDDMIKELVRRGAVIGAVFDAWMLVPGWIRGQHTPESSGLKLERCKPCGHRVGSGWRIWKRANPDGSEEHLRSDPPSGSVGRPRLFTSGCGRHYVPKLPTFFGASLTLIENDEKTGNCGWDRIGKEKTKKLGTRAESPTRRTSSSLGAPTSRRLPHSPGLNGCAIHRAGRARVG
jgi:membrane dipeptidase